jgi:hypothetical protein
LGMDCTESLAPPKQHKPKIAQEERENRRLFNSSCGHGPPSRVQSDAAKA